MIYVPVHSEYEAETEHLKIRISKALQRTGPVAGPSALISFNLIPDIKRVQELLPANIC